VKSDIRAKGRIQPEDLFRIQMGSHPRLSPDGETVIWVVHCVMQQANTYHSHLWLTATGAGDSRPFTQGPQRDTQPEWSPDGKHIAFISNRLGSWQVFVIPRDGGEARVVTGLPGGSISGVMWSPDGRQLTFAYHQAIEPDDGRGWRPPDGMQVPRTAPRVRYLTRFPFKEEPGGFIDAGFSQIYTLDLADGRCQMVAPGSFNQSNPVFSPCGTKLAFLAIRPEDPGFLTQGLDLWIVDLATGIPSRLYERYGPPIRASWSPDGTRLATLAYRDFEHSAEFHNQHVVLVPLDGSEPTVPTRELDRYCHIYLATDIKAPGTGTSPPLWTDDGRSLRFIALDRGSALLYEVDVEGGPVRALTSSGRCVLDVSAGGGKTVILGGDPGCIQDLWMLESSGDRGHSLRRLTEINRDYFESVDTGVFEETTVEARDGTPLQGWILYPPDFDPSRKYPLVLQIHGGPHIEAGWIFFHECWILAAQGYIVAQFNPRGSHGYGEAFAEVIFGAWGTVDYDDLMDVVDALEKAPYVDEDRLGVTGGSYGGYMTNWIVGHTNRFKAAVSHRSTSNLVSAAGSSDMGFENARNAYRHHAWENAAKLMEMSPISYVQNVTTPIMLTQSDRDERCPVEQAEQFYSALRYLGKEAAFCRFPEESHELSRWGRPDRRMERLYRTLQWFETYL